MATTAPGAPTTSRRTPFQLLTCLIYLNLATDIRVRKASPASARHRHAVNRGDIVDAGRARQPRARHEATMLAHVAACHGQTRHSRLGGGGDALLERWWCAAAGMKSRSRRPMRGRQCAADMAGGAQSAALVARSAWWRRRLAGEASMIAGWRVREGSFRGRLCYSQLGHPPRLLQSARAPRLFLQGGERGTK